MRRLILAAMVAGTASQAPAAEDEAVCVLMDGDTRRPMPFPDPTRQALESMLRPKPE